MKTITIITEPTIDPGTMTEVEPYTVTCIACHLSVDGLTKDDANRLARAHDLKDHDLGYIARVPVQFVRDIMDDMPKFKYIIRRREAGDHWMKVADIKGFAEYALDLSENAPTKKQRDAGRRVLEIFAACSPVVQAIIELKRHTRAV